MYIDHKMMRSDWKSWGIHVVFPEPGEDVLEKLGNFLLKSGEFLRCLEVSRTV